MDARQDLNFRQCRSEARRRSNDRVFLTSVISLCKTVVVLTHRLSRLRHAVGFQNPFSLHHDCIRIRIEPTAKVDVAPILTY